MQLAVRVLACFGREVEQMGAEGGPSRFVGEAGDVVINAIEVGDHLGSDELFGGEVEAVGVALDRVEESGGWVVELVKHGGGGLGCVVAGEDLLEALGRRGGVRRSRADDAVRVAVADDLEVEVVGVPAA